MEKGRFDDEVRVAIYRAFVEQGRAPVAAEIARIVTDTPARVEEAFHRLHEAHLLVLAQGSSYIWMANPFSALPTAYTVSTGGKTFWGNSSGTRWASSPYSNRTEASARCVPTVGTSSRPRSATETSFPPGPFWKLT